MAVSPWTLVTLLCSDLVERMRKGGAGNSSRSLSDLWSLLRILRSILKVLQQRWISPSLPQLKVCGEAARGEIEGLFTIWGENLGTIWGKTFLRIVN